jgi:hypothetical protein
MAFFRWYEIEASEVLRRAVESRSVKRTRRRNRKDGTDAICKSHFNKEDFCRKTGLLNPKALPSVFPTIKVTYLTTLFVTGLFAANVALATARCL